jgi:hypothetical protein
LIFLAFPCNFFFFSQNIKKKKMTIGLSNCSTRARYGMKINESTGGGCKKAGFPYIIGRNSWLPIFIRYDNLDNLSFLTKNRGPKIMGYPMPVGSDRRIRMRM